MIDCHGHIGSYIQSGTAIIIYYFLNQAPLVAEVNLINPSQANCLLVVRIPSNYILLIDFFTALSFTGMNQPESHNFQTKRSPLIGKYLLTPFQAM